MVLILSVKLIFIGQENVLKLCTIGQENVLKLCVIGQENVSGDYSYKGVLTENYVANEINKQFNGLYYWTRKNDSNGNKGEVDFVIQSQDKVIPIEVKAGNNKAQSLNIYNDTFRPELMIKIGNNDFGIKDNLKTIPFYATILLYKL